MPSLYSKHSYSIEAEDLLLANIISNVLQRHEPGLYVDLGAAHPVEHSNTYLFYERGWRGICIEPNPDFAKLYSTLRPEDVILNVGVLPHGGALAYHRFTQPLINGFFGRDMVDMHIRSGETLLDTTEIDCLSVGELLRTHLAGKRIDILNIDVETLDALILGTWDWAVCRPSVICAEIHTSTIDTMLESDVCTIMRRSNYAPMSRGIMSSIFVDRDKL